MNRKYFVFFFLVTLELSRTLFVYSSSSMEIDAQGYVTKVIDGDTIDVSNFGRIRLADIDAPESGETGFLQLRII